MDKNELNQEKLNDILGAAPRSFMEENNYFRDKNCFSKEDITGVRLPEDKKASLMKRAFQWARERVKAMIGRNNTAKVNEKQNDVELSEAVMSQITKDTTKAELDDIIK